MMADGRDMSDLFAAVVKNVVSKNVEASFFFLFFLSFFLSFLFFFFFFFFCLISYYVM